jgi:hypothetical protein
MSSFVFHGQDVEKRSDVEIFFEENLFCGSESIRRGAAELSRPTDLLRFSAAGVRI